MLYAVDSRNISRPEQTVFFALKGSNNNGHDYVSGLYERGVRHFVVSEHRPEFEKLAGAEFRYVEDTLDALQKDAAEYRAALEGVEVVGITGSNGKTVVKEWISQMAPPETGLYRSPRSYNSQVGVPLSLLSIPADAGVALIEAGMSRPGEMSRIEAMIRPEVGIFTHLGDAHGENFPSMDEKLREKAQLFKGCRTVVVREGETALRLRDILEEGAIASDAEGIPTFFTWGSSENADVRILSSYVEDNSRWVEILASGGGMFVRFGMTIPFADEASFENCMTAVSYLLYKGVPSDVIAVRAAELQPVAMRMEIKEGINGCTLIKDYYNSDPASFALALNTLISYNIGAPAGSARNKMRRAVVLSDFVDIDDSSSDVYSQVAAQLSEAGISLFIGVGPQLCAHRELFKLPSVRFYEDTAAFLAHENRSTFYDMLLLVKGARKFHFEDIGAFLSKQSHTTVLEVDLDALSRNFHRYRRAVPKGTRMAVMVKAFSYGSGAGEVAAQLQYCGADYLMVAYTDEGVELRNKGITAPIGVMNPEPESLSQIIEFSLEPEIYSIGMLHAFEAEVARLGLENYPVHVKLNTGMNRSGLDMRDLGELLEFLDGRRTIVIRSLFSHLAAADDPAEDDFTLEQIMLFEQMSSIVQAKFDYKILRHILNSAGIERFPQFAFDMVRLGIGVYGIGNFGADDRRAPGGEMSGTGDAVGFSALEPVSAFKTHIAAIRTVQPGQTIGYGRHGRVTRESRIAVIPVGYADGLDRHLSRGVGEMYIGGHRVPIIGNICMDACMLDVTDVLAAVGDEVEIFGRNIPVTELAEKIGTIPYEILTSIAPRVKRVYYKE